ncbi:MAG TPA: ACP S-malonyltransferase [Acidobacteriota bacterium]|nr:ACP S-malonyltransferase [Acidobacteriota bacterium]HND20105.1 ACP S-malonyltransferase [Acidobacteriota bacterium]HNG96505.1 ACP S-malonyltransferase [Acidobacteriota bacterium]HNH83595.1 ACP S-malonyltransferase [Acidobacteriota bacterium]HNJ40867.1 ACP S-malonyltransferase [Acidobacteriota bacterium]
MGSIAFLFPGQASQYAGMGKALAEAFSEARTVFEEADASLGFSISQLCFEGPEADLALTANTQPAILTVSVAAYRVLASQGLTPAFVAGHSLGEYSALVAAGTLSLTDAVVAVRRRGTYMQEAVPPGVGAMAAVLKADLATIEAICAEAAQDQVCSPANMNSPAQIVIAGHAEAVTRAAALLKAKGARAVMLPVSAPFHCALMKPAEERLAVDLNQLDFADPAFPVVANVSADLERTGAEARANLIAQVCSPVRWVGSIQKLVAEGVTTFVEVGPKTVLSGLVRQINNQVKVLNFEQPDQLEAIREACS